MTGAWLSNHRDTRPRTIENERSSGLKSVNVSPLIPSTLHPPYCPNEGLPVEAPFVDESLLANEGPPSEALLAKEGV